MEGSTVANPFDVQRSDGVTTLAIRGSLNINTAPALAEEIDKIIATKTKQVTVELGELDLIDSSGVAALVKLYKGVRILRRASRSTSCSASSSCSTRARATTKQNPAACA
jgi:anti-anti-sigma factor